MKITKLTPDQEILREMGTRLARVRKQQGFTQDELSGLAGIGIATLRRIEDGQDSQLSSWLKLLRALNMAQSVDALLPENFRSPMAEVKASAKKRKQRAAISKTPVWRDEAES